MIELTVLVLIITLATTLLLLKDIQVCKVKQEYKPKHRAVRRRKTSTIDEISRAMRSLNRDSHKASSAFKQLEEGYLSGVKKKNPIRNRHG